MLFLKDDGEEQEEEVESDESGDTVAVPKYCVGVGASTSAGRYGYSLIYPPLNDPETAKWYSEICRIASVTITRPWTGRLPKFGTGGINNKGGKEANV